MNQIETNNRSRYILGLVNKYVNFVILIVLLLLLFPPNFEMVQLQVNRAKWHLHDVHHYQYQLKRICHCDATPLMIEVRDERIVSIMDDHGTYSDPEGLNSFSSAETVDGLFEQIRTQVFKMRRLDAEYDNKYGFPVWILFDPEGSIDGGAIYEINNFEVLP